MTTVLLSIISSIPCIINIWFIFKFSNKKKESLIEIGNSTIPRKHIFISVIISGILSFILNLLIYLSVITFINLYTIGDVTKLLSSLYASVSHRIIIIIFMIYVVLFSIFLCFYINTSLRYYYANFIYLSTSSPSMNIFVKLYKCLIYTYFKLFSQVVKSAILSILHSINLFYFLNPNKKESYLSIIKGDVNIIPIHDYNYQYIRIGLLTITSINYLVFSFYLNEQCSLLVHCVFLSYIIFGNFFSNNLLNCLVLYDDITANEKGYANMDIVSKDSSGDMEKKVEMQTKTKKENE